MLLRWVAVCFRHAMRYSRTARKVSKKLIFVVTLCGLISAALLVSRPSEAATYTAGSTIIIPITVTATLPVVAADVTVSVQGGEFQQLTCGGSGFTVVTSSSNGCTLLHTGGGVTQGTVATATVKANASGTLDVSAQGSLTGALSTPVSGQFSGATHTILGAPLPLPTTSITGKSLVPEIVQPTAAFLQKPLSVEKIAPKKKSQKTSTAPASSTSTTSPSPASSAPVSSSRASNKKGEGTLTLDRKAVASGRIVLESTTTEVVFTANSLKSDSTPLVIVMPSDPAAHVTLDFSAFLSSLKAPVPNITLPQPIQFEKSNNEIQAVVTLPANAAIELSPDHCGVSTWDGTMMAPTFITRSTIAIAHGTTEIAVEVGRGDCQLNLTQPLHIRFPHKAGRVAAYRSYDQTEFTTITTPCATDATRPLPLDSEACYATEGDALTVWSQHATQFIAYKKSFKRMLWITLSGIGISGIFTAVYLYRRYVHRNYRQQTN